MRTAELHSEGIGLGLTIAKDVVERFGGAIWAESEGLEQGSTFVIEMPLDLITVETQHLARNLSQQSQRVLRQNNVEPGFASGDALEVERASSIIEAHNDAVNAS